MSKKISFKNTNNPGITMSALINFPAGFNESRIYPAIVATHPGGGVKEQTAGLYAEKLALRPLADTAAGVIVSSLAREGGLKYLLPVLNLLNGFWHPRSCFRLEVRQLAPPERVIAPPTLLLTYERNKGMMP